MDQHQPVGIFTWSNLPQTSATSLTSHASESTPLYRVRSRSTALEPLKIVYMKTSSLRDLVGLLSPISSARYTRSLATCLFSRRYTDRDFMTIFRQTRGSHQRTSTHYSSAQFKYSRKSRPTHRRSRWTSISCTMYTSCAAGSGTDSRSALHGEATRSFAYLLHFLHITHRIFFPFRSTVLAFRSVITLLCATLSARQS
jgi:hypothetical protein